MSSKQAPDKLKALIKEHTQEKTVKRWLSLFRAEIEREHPNFIERFGEPDSWRIGLRNQDRKEDFDALVDAEVVFHEPVTHTAAERGPHFKVRNKVLEYHLHLRHPDDAIAGGDFQLYAFNRDGFVSYGNQQQIANRECLTLVKTVPYKANTAVAWVNSKRTITAYSPREPGPYALRYMAFVIQLPGNLFPLPSRSTNSL